MTLSALHRGNGRMAQAPDPPDHSFAPTVTWSDRFLHQAHRFFYELTEPANAVGMAVGATAFHSMRALIQPALMRSALPLFSQVPFVTRFTSAALATVPEVGAFWGSSKAIQAMAHPDKVHWDRATASEEMLDLGLSLGLLKVCGFAFGGIGTWVRQQQLIGLPQHPLFWNQSGMLAGIMAGHGLAIARRHGPVPDFSNFLTDSLITLGQFNAGGILSQKLLPGLYHVSEVLQQRMAIQEKLQWEKLQGHGFDDFFSKPALADGDPGFLTHNTKAPGPSREHLFYNEGQDAPTGSGPLSEIPIHPELLVRGPFPERTGGPIDPFEETGSSLSFPRDMVGRLLHKAESNDSLEGQGAEKAAESIFKELEFQESDVQRLDRAKLDRISESDYGLALGSALRAGIEEYLKLRQRSDDFRGKNISQVHDPDLRLWVWQMDHLIDLALYAPRAGKTKITNGLREGLGELGRAHMEDLKAGLIALLSPRIGRDIIGPNDGALSIGWGNMLSVFALLRHRIMPGGLSWRYQLVATWDSPETAKEIREQGTHFNRLKLDKRVHYADDPKILAVGKNDRLPITREQVLRSFRLQFLNIPSSFLHDVLNQDYVEHLPKKSILVEGIKGWIGKDRGEYKPGKDEQQTLLPFELINQAFQWYRRSDAEVVHMAGFIPSAKLWFHHSGGKESANPRPHVVFAGQESPEGSRVSPAASLVKELFVGPGKDTPYLVAEASHRQRSSELGGAMKNIVSLIAGREAVRFAVEMEGKDFSRLNLRDLFEKRFFQPNKIILLDTLRRENVIKNEENIEFEGPVYEDLENCLWQKLSKIREMYEEIIKAPEVPLHDSRAFAQFIIQNYLPKHLDYTATRNPFLGIIIEMANQLRIKRGATLKVSEVVKAIPSKAISLEGADSIAPFIARNTHKSHPIELRIKANAIYELHDLLHPNTPADRAIEIPRHVLKALKGAYPSIDVQELRDTLEVIDSLTVRKIEKEIEKLDKLMELAPSGDAEITAALTRDMQFLPHYIRAAKMGKPVRVSELPQYELPYQNAARIDLGESKKSIQGHYSFLRVDGNGILDRATQLGMYFRSLPTDAPHSIHVEVTGLSGRENARKYWEVQTIAKEILGAFIRYNKDLKIQMHVDRQLVIPDPSPRAEFDREAYYQGLAPLLERLNRPGAKADGVNEPIGGDQLRKARWSHAELLNRFVQGEEGWPSLVKYYGGPMQRALKSAFTRPEKQTLVGIYSSEQKLIDTFTVYRGKSGLPMALSHAVTKQFQAKMGDAYKDLTSMEYFEGFPVEEFLLTYEDMLAKEGRPLPDYRIIQLKSLPLEQAMAAGVPGVNPIGLRAFLKIPSEARDEMLHALDPLYEYPFEDIKGQVSEIISHYLTPFEQMIGEPLLKNQYYRLFEEHFESGYNRLISREWKNRLAALIKKGRDETPPAKSD